MEGFAGGGTLVAALTGNPTFQLVAGIKIAPDFADEWQAQPVGNLAITRTSGVKARLPESDSEATL